MRLIILILLFTPFGIFAQNISIELNKNWQFKNQKENKWYKGTVPGTVHTDLLGNKLIPDPFYRDNESKLQWIDKADWEYKTVFNVDAQTFEKKNIELVFDGLDTYAAVYLNGKLILQADNMFRGWTVNVKSLIKKTNNELLIKFASAQNKVDSIAKARLPFVLPDNNRVYVRKAQFQFGWDWGPKFVGCGIWKNINLLGWDVAKINSLQIIKVDTLPQNHLDSFFILIKQQDSEYIGTLKLEISITASLSDSFELYIADPIFDSYLTMHLGGGTLDPNSMFKGWIVLKEKLEIGENKVTVTLPFRKFLEWNPNNSRFIHTLKIDVWHGKVTKSIHPFEEMVYEDSKIFNFS